jgi:hypothetical protein
MLFLLHSVILQHYLQVYLFIYAKLTITVFLTHTLHSLKAPWLFPQSTFRIWLHIRRDIRYYSDFSGVNETVEILDRISAEIATTMK